MIIIVLQEIEKFYFIHCNHVQLFSVSRNKRNLGQL